MSYYSDKNASAQLHAKSIQPFLDIGNLLLLAKFQHLQTFPVERKR